MRRCVLEVQRLSVEPDPVVLAARLASLEGFTALIGSGSHKDARYSILGALPREEIVVPAGTRPGDARPFERLAELVGAITVEDPPPGPFSCGVIALLGYDLRIHTERLPDRHRPDPGCPDLLARAFDAAIVCDRVKGSVELLQLVDPDDPGFSRRAAARAERLREAVLRTGVPEGRLKPAVQGGRPEPAVQGGRLEPAVQEGRPKPAVQESREDYIRSVEQILELIRAGEVYQVNFSQRVEGPWRGDALGLLERVVDLNPAPFGALVSLGPDSWLLSASPERFLQIDGSRVVTRPIKGTIGRGATHREDAANAKMLLESPKDRAELAMVIDLLRNDLARSCRAGTVAVLEPFALETHPTIHHLVATIAGEIAASKSPVDVVRNAWPGGSISGVPKIRALQVIDELERSRRGPYTGSIGWFGFDGRADLNILIRTLRLDGGRAWLHGGGGVTIRSDPEAEWRESLIKVQGLFEALQWSL